IEVQPDIPYASNAFGVAPDFRPWRCEVHGERPVCRSLIAFQPGFDATATDRLQNNGQPRVRLRRDLRPCRPRLYVDLECVHRDVVGDADRLTYGRDSVGGTGDRHVAAKTTLLTRSRILESYVGHDFRFPRRHPSAPHTTSDDHVDQRRTRF